MYNFIQRCYNYFLSKGITKSNVNDHAMEIMEYVITKCKGTRFEGKESLVCKNIVKQFNDPDQKFGVKNNL